ncbi:hypothetical protein BU25DRAFT_454073 [Macroventuria anomochaeta]|uniref:Uncharacterized protein n=1 Tax=Macroventuria anomochaeta TaxID=301207 RepID=A0ACB6SH44_9PLEO|nr:uncharacterized protein BU25DRAFT_454073 [Macroventuria anomochaeta]KAF2632905.1 hypothetical protein BU25DRAFT_454073 [Macroventuria anomochaeta]
MQPRRLASRVLALSTITAPPSAITTAIIATVPGTTSYVFRRGNPPAPASHKRGEATDERNDKPQRPGYLNAFGDEVTSSGCKCLDIPVKTVVVSKTSTATSAATVSEAIAGPVFTLDAPTEHDNDYNDTPVKSQNYKHKGDLWSHHNTIPMRNTTPNTRPYTTLRQCRLFYRP